MSPIRTRSVQNARSNERMDKMLEVLRQRGPQSPTNLARLAAIGKTSCDYLVTLLEDRGKVKVDRFGEGVTTKKVVRLPDHSDHRAGFVHLQRPRDRVLQRRSNCVYRQAAQRRQDHECQRGVPCGRPAPAEGARGVSCWLRENGVYVASNLISAFHGAPVTSLCEGRIDPVHLIPQRLLRRELGSRKAGWEELVVPGCRKHHHLLDVSRRLKIPRERLPESVERFAAAHGLGWYLDREYGAAKEKREAA